MDAKTKKILIYGAVALGAYLLYKKYSKKDETVGKKDETVVVVTDEIGEEAMSEASGRLVIVVVVESRVALVEIVQTVAELLFLP
jgi:hypothetical protein